VRLLFMTDYSADPLWDLETGGMVSLDKLPLPAPLRREVRAWAATVDKLNFAEMDAEDRDAERPPPEARARRGLRAAI
jgi:hypothetical protein